MKLDRKCTGVGMAAYEADLPPIPDYVSWFRYDVEGCESGASPIEDMMSYVEWLQSR